MIIYSATNLINNKKYIGQTNRGLSVRINEHHYYAFKKKSSNLLHRALRKYGKKNFKWDILCRSGDQEELNKMEKKYIEKYKTLALSKTGYNIREGGSRGRLSEETKRKIGDAHRGRVLSKQHIEKIAFYSQGSRNGRFIHLTDDQKKELYDDFTLFRLTNKEIEKKYNMSRPTVYRKIRAMNSNLDKDFKNRRYRTLCLKNPKGGGLS